MSAPSTNEVFANYANGISSWVGETWGDESRRLRVLLDAALKMEPSMLRLGKAIDAGTGTVRFRRPDGSMVTVTVGRKS